MRHNISSNQHFQLLLGRLDIFKKRLYRMDAGSGQMVYVYFQNPTYPGDFPGTDFLIFRAADHE